MTKSDNADLVTRRNISDLQSRVFVEVEGTSPTADPARMTFTLEAAVFTRSTVTQSIDLFNFLTRDFEEFDSRPASQFSDLVTVVESSGDLSRFVEPLTGCVRARIRFQSLAPRQQFSASIDQTIWEIGHADGKTRKMMTQEISATPAPANASPITAS